MLLYSLEFLYWLLQNNLFVTIIMSLLWSTTCFIALLMTFGPNRKESGDIGVLFASCVKRIRGESENGSGGRGNSATESDDAPQKETKASRQEKPSRSASVSPEPTRDEHAVTVQDVNEDDDGN